MLFGYITPLKAELKVKDFTKFRSYYCGLCFELKNSAGNIPRMALNYDMTFISILLDSLSIKENNIEIKRCLPHPTDKKPLILNNDALRYTAAISLSLYYYKLNDNILDDNNLKSKLLAKVFHPYQKKTNKYIRTINEIIKTNLNFLNELEKNKSFSSLDEICHPFSDILGNILKLYNGNLIYDNEDLRNKLYSFGYTLGKWIYLIDAFDDLEKDMNENKFNPINTLYNTDNKSYSELIPKIKDRVEFNILNCSYNCKEVLSTLPLQKNEAILKNVLELGMTDKYIEILNKALDSQKISK